MAKAVFREPDREGLAEAGFTGVDMHFHTDRSMDSLARIDLVLKKAKKLGVGVAMTDHNEVAGGLRFAKNRQGVLVIPGVELTSSEGTHTILYFGTRRECEDWSRRVLAPLKKKDPFRLPATTEELYERAQPYNAVVCAPHPFGTGAVGVHKIHVTKKMVRLIDAVEGINAYVTHAMNTRAIQWADRIKKPVTAGSDGHVLAELGQALTFCQAHDAHEFLDEIQRGHCIAMGKENSLYEKAMVGLVKEDAFLGRAHRNHEGLHLLRGQLGAEWSYLKAKVKKGALHRMHHLFHAHHG
jgi:predicted metal-dependent phosphoesterase TrpH